MTTRSANAPDAVAPAAAAGSAVSLRLLWPQWQGATAENVRELFPEAPADAARRGYAVGTRVLAALLPDDGSVVDVVPTEMDADDATVTDGIESRDVLLRQLRAALEVIARHDPARITTIGGECSVSVAPFAALRARYGDDLAVVWIDSHPDVGTPQSDYAGYHAMAVSLLLGHGDREFVDALPATVDAAHVALAGLHAWTDDDFPHIAQWGLSSFSPDDLRADSTPLLAWLRDTGCTKVAIHLDVDTVDGNEVVLGLGAEPGGLRIAQVQRLVADLGGAAEIVGLTLAEYIPRQVVTMQQFVEGLPTW